MRHIDRHRIRRTPRSHQSPLIVHLSAVSARATCLTLVPIRDTVSVSLRLRKAFANRETDELAAIMKVQFRHDLLTVAIDCLRAPVQQFRNLGTRVALSDQAKDLCFTGRQGIEFRLRWSQD